MQKLQAITDSEVHQLHEATLAVLSEAGIILTHPEARALLADHGATLRGDRVLLPPELVETQVALCPPQVSLRGRGGGTVTLGDGVLKWHNLGGARDVYDHETGRKHPAVLQDLRDATRLLDALPVCTTITPLYTPQDVPGELMSLSMYRHALPCTTKPLQGPGVLTAAEVKLAVQMCAVIGNPLDMLSLAVSPVSPLTFSDHVTGAIIAVARSGSRFSPLPCPTAGATAPFSIAGAVVQQNAEVLAAVVLAELVRPGLPIIYCGRLAMMEPRTVSLVWSGVELGLASAATVQLAHYYHLPCNVYGFSTNSHTLDLQSGFERSLNAVIPALAGADELSGIGELEAGVLSSNAQLVLDNELGASVHRLVRGFAVDDDSLAVSVIADVMQTRTNFLDKLHTVRYLRGGEVLKTPLAERRPWEQWDQAGRDDMADRAQAEADRLLATHHVPPLAPEQERELDILMQAAEKELIGR